MKQENSQYRAWSEDWSKSIVFTGDLINSNKWDAFKSHMAHLLGNGFRWELSMGDSIRTDTQRFDYNSFKIGKLNHITTKS